jgi:hypothetical protein
VKFSKSKFAALGLAALLAAVGAHADDSGSDQSAIEDLRASLGALTARMNSVESKSGSGVEVHGFAEIDMFNDDTQSFQEVVGEGGVKLPNSSYASNNGVTQFSPRNSRIDVLGKTEMGDWKAKGYVEGDFFGFEGSGPAFGTVAAGTDDASLPSEYKFYSQPTFRLRHAYLDAENSSSGLEILAGQWWSLYGWNMDYVLATVAVNPVMGTLYQRTPQFRVQENLGGKDWTLQIAADAERPAQAVSDAPNVVEGVRFKLNGWKARFAPATGASKAVPFSIGVSEYNARYDWVVSSTAGSNETDSNVWGSAVAGDIFVPIMPSDDDGFSIALVGEATSGAGDTLGFNGGGFTGLKQFGAVGGAFATNAVESNADAGAIGLDKNNRVNLVQIDSYNAQLQVSLPRSIGTLVTVGFGDIFSPNAQAMVGTPGFAANSVYDSDITYFANVMQDFGPIRFGLEYAEFCTNYLALGAAQTGPNVTAYDHRVQFSSWYRF